MLKRRLWEIHQAQRILGQHAVWLSAYQGSALFQAGDDMLCLGELAALPFFQDWAHRLGHAVEVKFAPWPALSAHQASWSHAVLAWIVEHPVRSLEPGLFLGSWSFNREEGWDVFSCRGSGSMSDVLLMGAMRDRWRVSAAFCDWRASKAPKHLQIFGAWSLRVPLKLKKLEVILPKSAVWSLDAPLDCQDLKVSGAGFWAIMSNLTCRRIHLNLEALSILQVCHLRGELVGQVRHVDVCESVIVEGPSHLLGQDLRVRAGVGLHGVLLVSMREALIEGLWDFEGQGVCIEALETTDFGAVHASHAKIELGKASGQASWTACQILCGTMRDIQWELRSVDWQQAHVHLSGRIFWRWHQSQLRCDTLFWDQGTRHVLWGDGVQWDVQRCFSGEQVASFAEGAKLKAGRMDFHGFWQWRAGMFQVEVFKSTGLAWIEDSTILGQQWILEQVCIKQGLKEDAWQALKDQLGDVELLDWLWMPGSLGYARSPAPILGNRRLLVRLCIFPALNLEGFNLGDLYQQMRGPGHVLVVCNDQLPSWEALVLQGRECLWMAKNGLGMFWWHPQSPRALALGFEAVWAETLGEVNPENRVLFLYRMLFGCLKSPEQMSFELAHHVALVRDHQMHAEGLIEGYVLWEPGFAAWQGWMPQRVPGMQAACERWLGAACDWKVDAVSEGLPHAFQKNRLLQQFQKTQASEPMGQLGRCQVTAFRAKQFWAFQMSCHFQRVRLAQAWLLGVRCEGEQMLITQQALMANVSLKLKNLQINSPEQSSRFLSIRLDLERMFLYAQARFEHSLAHFLSCQIGAAVEIQDSTWQGEALVSVKLLHVHASSLDFKSMALANVVSDASVWKAHALSLESQHRFYQSHGSFEQCRMQGQVQWIDGSFQIGESFLLENSGRFEMHQQQSPVRMHHAIVQGVWWVQGHVVLNNLHVDGTCFALNPWMALEVLGSLTLSRTASLGGGEIMLRVGEQIRCFAKVNLLQSLSMQADVIQVQGEVTVGGRVRLQASTYLVLQGTLQAGKLRIYGNWVRNDARLRLANSCHVRAVLYESKADIHASYFSVSAVVNLRSERILNTLSLNTVFASSSWPCVAWAHPCTHELFEAGIGTYEAYVMLCTLRGFWAFGSWLVSMPNWQELSLTSWMPSLLSFFSSHHQSAVLDVDAGSYLGLVRTDQAMVSLCLGGLSAALQHQQACGFEMRFSDVQISLLSSSIVGQAHHWASFSLEGWGSHAGGFVQERFSSGFSYDRLEHVHHLHLAMSSQRCVLNGALYAGHLEMHSGTFLSCSNTYLQVRRLELEGELLMKRSMMRVSKLVLAFQGKLRMQASSVEGETLRVLGLMVCHNVVLSFQRVTVMHSGVWHAISEGRVELFGDTVDVWGRMQIDGVQVIRVNSLAVLPLGLIEGSGRLSLYSRKARFSGWVRPDTLSLEVDAWNQMFGSDSSGLFLQACLMGFDDYQYIAPKTLIVVSEVPMTLKGCWIKKNVILYCQRFEAIDALYVQGFFYVHACSDVILRGGYFFENVLLMAGVDIIWHPASYVLNHDLAMHAGQACLFLSEIVQENDLDQVLSVKLRMIPGSTLFIQAQQLSSSVADLSVGHCFLRVKKMDFLDLVIKRETVKKKFSCQLKFNWFKKRPDSLHLKESVSQITRSVKDPRVEDVMLTPLAVDRLLEAFQKNTCSALVASALRAETPELAPSASLTLGYCKKVTTTYQVFEHKFKAQSVLTEGKTLHIEGVYDESVFFGTAAFSSTKHDPSRVEATEEFYGLRGSYALGGGCTLDVFAQNHHYRQDVKGQLTFSEKTFFSLSAGESSAGFAYAHDKMALDQSGKMKVLCSDRLQVFCSKQALSVACSTKDRAFSFEVNFPNPNPDPVVLQMARGLARDVYQADPCQGRANCESMSFPETGLNVLSYVEDGKHYMAFSGTPGFSEPGFWGALCDDFAIALGVQMPSEALLKTSSWFQERVQGSSVFIGHSRGAALAVSMQGPNNQVMAWECPKPPHQANQVWVFQNERNLINQAVPSTVPARLAPASSLELITAASAALLPALGVLDEVVHTLEHHSLDAR